MIIVGLTGGIGEGKTTFLNSMVRAEPDSYTGESSLVISEVANKMRTSFGKLALQVVEPTQNEILAAIDPELPTAVATATPLSFTRSRLIMKNTEALEQPGLFEKLWDYISLLRADPELVNTPITPENKDLHRPVLQWIGNYVTTKLDRSLWYEELIRRAETSEIAASKLYILGGVRYGMDADIIHAQPGGIVVEVSRPGMPKRDMSDPTELARAQITADVRVVNNGDLVQLDNLAAAFWQDVKTGHVEPVYQAKAF